MSTKTLRNSLARKKGLTLIELMIAIAVLAILLGVGIPQFNDLIDKTKAKAAAHKLFMAHQYTRFKAVTLRKELTLCGSEDGVTCSRTWKKQLIAFNDINKNNQLDSSEKIKTFEFNQSNTTITTAIAFHNSSVKFKPDGSVSFTGGYIYCKINAPHTTRKVTFNRPGRPYFSRLSYSNNGDVFDQHGDAVICT